MSEDDAELRAAIRRLEQVQGLPEGEIASTLAGVTDADAMAGVEASIERVIDLLRRANSAPLPGETELLDQLEAIKAQLRSVIKALESKDQTRPEVALRLAAVPQQTFQEAKTLGMALAALPYQRDWHDLEGEIALYYGVKGASLQVKLVGYPLLDLLPWLSLSKVPEGADDAKRRQLELANLRTVGAEVRTDAVLLAHVVMGHLLEDSGRFNVSMALDDLARELGWEARTAKQRLEHRRRLWTWLLVQQAMPVIGRRDGRWPTAGGKTIETDSTSVLFSVSARHDPARSRQTSFDPTEPPWAVTLAPGPWLEQWRGNESVLSYYGDLRTLARIPNGKPSGAWARSIGLALHQLWRERASRSRIVRVGADKTPTVQLPRRFTRSELLDLFPVSPPQPTWQEVLEDRPQRAWEYWDEAVKLLKVSLIGHYDELPRRSASVGRGAARWHDRRSEFKTQRLDVRPKREGALAIAEIVQRTKDARTRRRRTTAAATGTGGD